MKSKVGINGTGILRDVPGGKHESYFDCIYRANSLDHLYFTDPAERQAVYLCAVVVALLLGRFKLAGDFTYVHIIACFPFPLYSALYFGLLV